MEIDDLLELLSALPPGESVSIPKSVMPEIPEGFTRTSLGTPLWIAHPGATAQYRAPPALHAYELDNRWKVHRDRFDPGEDPVGQFFFDAPEPPIATACACIAGVLSYWYVNRRESEKSNEDRNPWLPAAMAAGVALVVWLVVYIIAAMARVALSGG